MKLTLELFRYGHEAEIPYQKRGRLALLLKADARHVPILADDNEQFDLDTVSAAIDALKRRAEVVAHLRAQG